MIVAHRGASATEAENTLPAFEAAIRAGADAVEFDVRTTADGHAVVMHDADVSRTTDGSGLVRSMTLQEVRALRIRTADGDETNVPTLDETLTFLSGQTFVDIEIKNIPGEPDFDPDGEAAVEAALASLERTGFSGGVLLTSFNPLSLARSRTLAPDIPTGLLTAPEVDGFVGLGYARAEGHPWLLPYKADALAAGADLVREAHTFGMRIGAWLTDDPSEAARLFDMGVDAVATNDPAVLIDVRRATS
ncbi:MAG: glycerophosphoryl diester phosphodiesterase [Actinomycetota bacterium]|jgi:glycerophosphoryl diester phosphodiesterase|nr:glycerophosphoryl diester phosphodiesterase [Actinomycetota bacterium]